MIILNEFDSKNVAIYGLQKTGLAVYESLSQSGANLFLWDDDQTLREKLVSKGLKLTEPTSWVWNDLYALIPSPGVPLRYGKIPEAIKICIENKIPIYGDIELFHKAHGIEFPYGRVVAITGTNGKSSTATLLNEILINEGFETRLAGNIGKPILSINPGTYETVYIIEISSFQLESIKKFRPDIAVLLNISEDHTDRYPSHESYRKTKLEIFKNQKEKDIAILNSIDSYRDLINKINIPSRKIIIEDSEIKYNLKKNSFKVLISELYPVVKSITNEFGIKRNRVLSGFSSFKNLEHRHIKILEKNNIKFVNDSKSTNPEATNFALRNYENIFLIVGGLSKENNLSKINFRSKNIRKAFFIGSSSRILSEIAPKNLNYEISGDIEKATQSAFKSAKKFGCGCVLLSPGCSSQDQFHDYAHRGEVFSEAVLSLVSKC